MAILKLIIIILFIITISSLELFAYENEPIQLAILEFKYHSDDSELDPFRKGLRDMLSTDLGSVPNVYIVERDRLIDVLKEFELTKNEYFDPKTVAKIGHVVGANTVLIGSYIKFKDKLRIDARLISVETGSQIFAQEVTGARSEIFDLEKELAEAIAKKLVQKIGRKELWELRQFHTRNLEAFEFYSEAVTARDKNQYEKANKALRLALSKDPYFGLAEKTIAAIEQEIIKLKEKIGKEKIAGFKYLENLLVENMENLEKTITARHFDPDYFAALLVLSARAGLIDDHCFEKKLLMNFWNEFITNVPVEKLFIYSNSIQTILVKHEKFFEDNFDSGIYEQKQYMIYPSKNMECFDHDYNEQWTQNYRIFIKPSLRDKYRWPRYSQIWPFNINLRKATANPVGNKKEILSKTHMYPHEYLKRLTDELISHESHVLPKPSKYENTLTYYISLLKYYAALETIPDDLRKDLSEINSFVIDKLWLIPPEKYDITFCKEVILVLRSQAKLLENLEQKERAIKILLKFVQHVKMVDKKTDLEKSEDFAQLYGINLSGPRIVFLRQISDTPTRNQTRVDNSLINTIRNMSPTMQVNIRLFQLFGQESVKWHGAFEFPIEIDNEAYNKIIDYLNLVKDPKKGPPKKTIVLERNEIYFSLQDILLGWPEKTPGDVVIICYKNATMERKSLDFNLALANKKNIRIHILSFVNGIQQRGNNDKNLAMLVASTGGKAIVLRSNHFDEKLGDDLIAKKWDVQKFKKPPIKLVDILPEIPEPLAFLLQPQNNLFKNREISANLNNKKSDDLNALSTHLSLPLKEKLAMTPRLYRLYYDKAEKAIRSGSYNDAVLWLNAQLYFSFLYKWVDYSWEAASHKDSIENIKIRIHRTQMLDKKNNMETDTITQSIKPDWSFSSNQKKAFLGRCVASAGDVNADGYDDVLVGSPYFSTKSMDHESNEGRAYLFLGSPKGLSKFPDWTDKGEQDYSHFGNSVASAGDVNGDGFSDVIIGAYGFYKDEAHEGRAYLYLGGPSGLSKSYIWTAEPNQPKAFFGMSVASAGDVNSDGFYDVIIGAPSDGKTTKSMAYLYLGGPLGLSKSPTWTAESDQGFKKFGMSVASAGDVNSDGYDDVIIGEPYFNIGDGDGGRAYLYFGNPQGLSKSPNWTAESDQVQSYFGRSVASAGDVNGDGFYDVIIGAYKSENKGHAYIYIGSPKGLSKKPTWVIKPDLWYSRFGSSVAPAGDMNGDGFDDILIGAPHFSKSFNLNSHEGRVYLYFGSPIGLSKSPGWIAKSDQKQSFFGNSIASAGDVNGDGHKDIIIGAYWAEDNLEKEGKMFLYLGKAPDQ